MSRLRDLWVFALELVVAFGLALLVFQLAGTGRPVLVAVGAGAVLAGIGLGELDARRRRP